MRSIDTIRLSTRVLRNNLLRSALTIGGIGIATGAIIYLISLGIGLQELTLGQVARSNTILTMDVLPAKGELKELTGEEIETISQQYQVAEVARLIALRGQLANHDNKSVDATIKAVDNNYLDLETVDYLAGQNFQSGEMVVSQSLAKVLNLEPLDLIGRSFEVVIIPSDTQPAMTLELTVAGVVKSGLSQDAVTIHLPLSAIDQTKYPIDVFPTIKVKAASITSLETVRQEISSLGFSVKAIVDVVAQIKKSFWIFQVILAVVGVIALVVAAIGMFNTLTISLLERTKEVGILRALGAAKRNIFYLFLTESLIIGLIGGLVGWLIAWLGQGLSQILISILATALDGKKVSVFANPPLLYLGMLGFVVLIAFLTGFYPAKRAARLNPIDAIRYE